MSQSTMSPSTQGGIPSAISWQLQLIAGFITLVLGVVLFAHGSGALNVICVILGILLIVGGVFHFIRALDRGEQHRIWLTVVGVAEVVIGIIFIRHLGFTQLVIALWIGITWIVQGILMLMVGIMGESGRSRAWPIVFGLISLIAGIVVVSLPHESLSTLVVILGIIFLIMGVLEIVGGFVVRHDMKKLGV